MPVLDSLTKQGIDIRAVSTAPQAIMIDREGGVQSTWDRTTDAKDLLLVLGAFGVIGHSSHELPDLTLMEEITPTTTPNSENVGDSTILIGASGFEQATLTQEIDDRCPGIMRLKLEGQFLTNFMKFWGISEPWKTRFRSLQIRERDHETFICIL